MNKFYLLVVAFGCALFLSAHAEIYSGTCGASMNWTLNTETGALVISGSGELELKSSNNYGWFDYVDYVTSVFVPEGMTYFSTTKSDNLIFGNCKNLKTVVWNAVNCGWQDGYNKAPFYNSGYSVAKNITSFTFGPNVRTIPAYLCSEMSGLTEIKIPQTVTTIYKYAFENCSGLTSVVLPEGLTGLGSRVFSGCSGLASINIPASLTRINDYMFYNCTSLSEITLHDKITYIGAKAFYYCPFTSITIPAGITSMGEAPFGYCTKLKTVVWNAVSCADFDSDNVRPFYETGETTVKGITSFFFGDTIKIIPGRLCDGMSSLTEVNIPSTVTKIGNYAFYGCSGLTSVVLPEGLKTLGGSAYSGCKGLVSVNIPSTVKQINSYTFYNCTSLSEITLHDKITYIGAKAFYYCPFTSITIPAGITSMGEAPFGYCTKLKTVVWNAVSCADFDSYNVRPFYETGETTVKGITSFIFGDTIKIIPGHLCDGMSSLTEVNIPSTVTKIGDYAFYGCSGLTSVVLPEGLKTLGGSAYSGCKGLVSVNIPSTVKQINSYTFYNCTSLPEITLHDKITYIGAEAFSYCPFTSITIPAGLTSMGNAPFTYCSNLKTVIWNAVNCSVGTSINTHPFYTISAKIKEVSFGDTIKTIPAYLCYGMTQLDSIVIPATVTKIGERAFSGCSALALLYNFAATPQSINSNVFSGVDQTACTLYIPKSAYNLYESAPVWKDFFQTEIPPVYTDLYETACDSYKWNDETYTSSQNVVKTFKAVNGNDSIVTLHLTINYSNIGEETLTAVGSYEWHGTTYTVSGDYNYTLTNSSGCDSVATLHLTIIPVWQVTVLQPEHGSIEVVEIIDLNKVVDKTELHFTATPDEGYVFDAWLGCDEDGSLIVTKDVTVSCTFMTGATAMEQTGDNKLCSRKVMIDGRIYILRNGRTYDVTGAELK